MAEYIAAPVVHGRWELEEYQSSQFGVDQSFRCSKCHTWADDDDNLTSCCPNCGAKMDEVDINNG